MKKIVAIGNKDQKDFKLIFQKKLFKKKIVYNYLKFKHKVFINKHNKIQLRKNAMIVIHLKQFSLKKKKESSNKVIKIVLFFDKKQQKIYKI